MWCNVFALLGTFWVFFGFIGFCYFIDLALEVYGGDWNDVFSAILMLLVLASPIVVLFLVIRGVLRALEWC